APRAAAARVANRRTLALISEVAMRSVKASRRRAARLASRPSGRAGSSDRVGFLFGAGSRPPAVVTAGLAAAGGLGTSSSASAPAGARTPDEPDPMGGAAATGGADIAGAAGMTEASGAEIAAGAATRGCPVAADDAGIVGGDDADGAMAGDGIA